VQNNKQIGLNKIREDLIKAQVAQTIREKFSSMVEAAFSLQKRIKQLTGFDLYSNQVDIVECMLAEDIKNLTLTGARSSGKTFGVLLGMALYSSTNRVHVGFTAPTQGQANRMIKTFIAEIASAKGIKEYITFKANTHIEFKNGTTWDSFSGGETSFPEGYHCDILIVDEAQDVTDNSMSNVLSPMMLHSKIGKTIKLGVPRLRNHFYRSSLSTLPTDVFLKHDVFQCPQIFNSGKIETGNPKYPFFPTSLLDKCPLSYKKIYFPITEERPYNDKYWVDGSMSEEDWETQLLLKWLTDAELFLNEEQQDLLYGDFVFDAPETEKYFFGLDLAGGAGTVKSKDSDFTSLTIGRIKDGVKQIIDAYEWQGDPMKQVQEILSIIHPVYGRYKCFAGMMDLGHNPIVKQILEEAGVTIRGVMFNQIAKVFGLEPNPTRMDYKNSMFKYFKIELENGRVRYPNREFIKNHRMLKKHMFEWSVLEEHRTNGVNSQIYVPESVGHDDCVCSAVLCCQSMVEMGIAFGSNLSSKKWFKTGIKKGFSPQNTKMSTLISSMQENDRYGGMYGQNNEGQTANPWENLIGTEEDPW